ncbi:WD repeat-containing protein 97 [Manis javanica]|nr:WD repeat-containing protein 97 [Manis javanica]
MLCPHPKHGARRGAQPPVLRPQRRRARDGALSDAELDRRGVALDLQLAPALQPAWADRVHIQQVLANLLLNAMDAMQGTPAAQRRITVTTQALGQQLVLTVADAGEGLSPPGPHPPVRAFWTTKPDGMGLGLNICRHMAEANGGRIGPRTARTRGGTVFHINCLRPGHGRQVFHGIAPWLNPPGPEAGALCLHRR